MLKHKSINEVHKRAREQFQILRENYEISKRTKYFRGFIYGRVKTGKTVALTTLPRPILIHSFDPGGLDSIREIIDEPNSEIYPVEFDINNTKLGERHNYSNLEPADVYTLWKDEFEFMRRERLFEHFASYVIDSATTFFSAMTDYIVATAPIPRGSADRLLDVDPIQSDYKLIKTLAIGVAGNILALPCHFIMTGHKIEKDEGEGRFTETIALTPATRASILPLFSEIYIADVIKKYVADKQTGEEHEVKQFLFRTEHGKTGLTAGSRSTNFSKGEPSKVLPKFVKQDFKLIFKTIGLEFKDKIAEQEAPKIKPKKEVQNVPKE